MNGRNFVCSIRFKGEEETWVTVSLLTHRFNSQQPSTITGGIEAFVEETCVKKLEQMCQEGKSAVLHYFNISGNNRVEEEGIGCMEMT